MKKTVLGCIFAALSMGAFAQATNNDGYLVDSSGKVVKTQYNLCVRTGSYDPAKTFNADCDYVGREPAVAQAPLVAPANPVPAATPTPVSQKMTFAADAFFDFDKAVLKAEGKKSLDDAAAKIKNLSVEVVIAVGHTDSIGSNNYNQRLSLRRAEAVKSYLVAQGVPAAQVYTEGKGETQPVADNATASGRAKNRRVEVEVVGTAK